jgi:tetratricopeptide (TPR) repeat protein
VTIDDHASAPTQVLGQAYFLDLLGDAYNGHYDEAIAVLSEAAEAFRRHDAQRAHAECLFKIAQSLLAKGRGELAIGYLEQCLPIFGELHLPDHERQAAGILNDCRAAAG